MFTSLAQRCLHAIDRLRSRCASPRHADGGRARDPSRPGSRFGVPAVLLAALVAGGCTTVPTTEFATYKDTFAKARAAGEEVLLDYGAAAAQADEIEAKRVAAKAGPRQRGERFDPGAPGRNGTKLDDVLVRMKAWDVVARYNDLLTALAEGRAADELAGAVDSLSASLANFPIAAVASTAAEVSGYLAPLRALALEAVREHSRRQFVAAVGKGGPLITDKFLKLLREDTSDFYRVRRILNDREISVLAESANATTLNLAGLAAGFQASGEIDGKIADLRTEIELLPVLAGGRRLVRVPELPAQRGGAALTPAAKTQMLSLAQDATAQVARVAAKDDELIAYRQVLVAYVVMLDQLEHSMRALQIAAEQAQPAIPQGADLQRVVVLLREAYITYRDKRKE